MSACGRRAAAALAAALAACGFAGGPDAPSDQEPRYHPTRGDYHAFRARHPETLEPNYLPFMVHRVEVAGEELLVLCRWEPADREISVYVEPPEIPDALKDEFDPRPPGAYRDAAWRALAAWEDGLEGLLRFRRVERAADAALHVRLVGASAPVPSPEIKVLGATDLSGACRAEGGDPASGRVDVRYRAPRVTIYVADEFGLLNADQVERVTLHELGHALGMRGHSRHRADLMHESLWDGSAVVRLSLQDLNSFLSLYALPNGTVYKRAPWDAAPRPAARAAEPELAIAPHVDARHGFEVRPPSGWMRIELPSGMLAVDGVSWDYDASFQVIVRNYPTIASYLRAHRRDHVARGRVVAQEPLELGGLPAHRIRVQRRESGFVEEHVFIEVGDGRLFIAIGDFPEALADAHRPVFDAILASLEIRAPVSAPDGDAGSRRSPRAGRTAAPGGRGGEGAPAAARPLLLEAPPALPAPGAGLGPADLGPAPRAPDGSFRNTAGRIETAGFAVRFPFFMRRAWTSLTGRDGAAARIANDGAFLRENHGHSVPTLTWIGHATLLVQMAGRSVLTDPIWSERASPVGFAGPKRFTPPGVAFDDLPPIDAVVVSHTHYDHLDLGTLRRLAARGDGTRFLVPLGVAGLLRANGVEPVVELDWGEHHDVGPLRFHCLPAQHWSQRGLRRDRRSLWASWAVVGPERRVWFAGDTGYFDGFREIGRALGPFDAALVPIGAYEPQAMMRPWHLDPEQAIQAARDTRARRAVAMHYGTFDLADEPLGEPPRRFRAAGAVAGFEGADVWTLQIGETRAF